MMFISMLAKVTLVLAAGAAIQIALAKRLSAATRHLVWMLAIAACCWCRRSPSAMPDWTPVEYTEPAGFRPDIRSGIARVSGVRCAGPHARHAERRRVARIFAAVYLAGVVLLLARIVLQHLWTHRLVRATTPIVEACGCSCSAECTARIGVRRAVRLMRTAGDTMPMAVGMRQPSIVLPAIADTWPEDRRRAVLLHELAHVERHDCLTQTLAAIACAVYWAHPGVWWIASAAACGARAGVRRSRAGGGRERPRLRRASAGAGLHAGPQRGARGGGDDGEAGRAGRPHACGA